MAVVNLTQEEREVVKSNNLFKQFIVNSIFAPATQAGGVSYYLALVSFANVQQAKAYVVSLMIQTQPSIVTQDQQLMDFIMTRMLVRDLDKKEDSAGPDLIDQVKAFLNTSTNILFLVDDYLAEKSKPW